MTFFKFFFSIFLLIPACNCRFSTKTAYLDSFTQSQLSFINDTRNYFIETCEPAQIYIVLRHGSRYPSDKQIKNSKQFLDDLRTYRSEQSSFKTSLIDEIFHSFDDIEPHGLSALGRKEMQEMGRRYKARFPKLFNEEIHVMSSSKARSVESAHSFLEGVYTGIEMDTFARSVDNIMINDRMMRLFDECEHYVLASRENATAFEEVTLFENGQHLADLIKRIKARNNLENFEILNQSILKELYTLCSIENAHRMPTNWCKLFADEDYAVISYLSDLKQYWKKSYGNEINSKPASLIIQDLFNEMDKHYRNEPKKRSVLLRFGHAENIIPLVTALGLYKNDKPLKARNFENNHDRKFKSSLLSPFSSNVAFVLQKCDSDSSFKVSLFVNELPVWQTKEAGGLECAAGEERSECLFDALQKQLEKYLRFNFESDCKIKNKEKTEEL